jgi:hypothetical protein
MKDMKESFENWKFKMLIVLLNIFLSSSEHLKKNVLRKMGLYQSQMILLLVMFSDQNVILISSNST